MTDPKRVLGWVGHQIRILGRGFARMLYGAATAGLIGLAVWGLARIPSEGGYSAVCDFILAIATMAVALCGMYTMGGGKKKGCRK